MGIPGIGRQVLSTRRISHRARHAADSSRQRNQKRFREKLAQDKLAARSESHAHGNLAGAIRRPRREKAAEVGARGQQDEARHEHQPGHEGARRPAQRISHQPRPRQRELQAVILFRIRLCQRSGNGVQVRCRRGGRHPGLQMADHPGEMGAALLHRIPSAHLRQVHQGRPQVRREEKLRAAKVGRRNPRNRVGMLVDLHGAAHRGRIAVEVTVPVGVAQHDVGHAVLSMLVGTMEEPAKIRLDAQRIEVIAADHVRPDDGGIPAARVEPHRALNVVGHQGFEAAVSIAQVEVIGIRLRGSASSFESSLQHEEAFGVRHIQRAKHQGIQHAEDNGIGANGQRQREHGGHRESWRLAQLAQGKSEIGDHASPL